MSFHQNNGQQIAILYSLLPLTEKERISYQLLGGNIKVKRYFPLQEKKI